MPAGVWYGEGMDEKQMDDLWRKADCPVNLRSRVVHAPLASGRCRTNEIVSKAMVNMDYVRERRYYDDRLRLCPHCWPQALVAG